MVEKIEQPLLWSAIHDKNHSDYVGFAKQWFNSSSLAMSFPVLFHVDARLHILSAHRLTVLLSAIFTSGFFADYLWLPHRLPAASVQIISV